MPERTHEFGKYGARGIRGGDAVARQLDRLVSFFSTPITSPRGLGARLRYLTSSKSARAAAREAGLTVSDRTIREWQRGMRKPNKANLERIEQTYRTMRRRNVARALLRRLNNDGRGTRVELHPQNQSAVDRPHQREVGFRTLNIRKWDRIIQAWAYGTPNDVHDAYVDQIGDLGSDWGMYEYVTNVGFAA